MKNPDVPKDQPNMTPKRKSLKELAETANTDQLAKDLKRILPGGSQVDVAAFNSSI